MLTQTEDLEYDDNTQLLVKAYTLLEKQLLDSTQPLTEEEEGLMASIEADAELKRYLLNKMFILSCYQPEIRQTYLKHFELMVEHGDEWVDALDNGETPGTDGYNDPEIDQQTLPG